jgi:hypothetical protein
MTKRAGRIDENDPDQLVRLALAALFTTAAIARGAEPNTMLATDSVTCANALVDAVASRDAP